MSMGMSMGMIQLKRVYEEPEPGDGYRVLTERLWPRGVSKERAQIRRRNYSYSTEKTYSQWIVRFVQFHNYTHPKSLNEEDVVHRTHFGIRLPHIY